MKNVSVLIVGLGRVGARALDLLSLIPRVGAIIAADTRKDYGRRRVNLTVAGAIHQGYAPKISFIPMDLNDIDGTAHILANITPTIVLNASCMQSWWAPLERLPKEARDKITHHGNDFSTQLVLPYKLMQAIKQAGIQTHVIQGSYADGVNCVLSKVGLTPTIGIGNIDLVVQILRTIVSERLDVYPQDINISLIMHHSVVVHILGGDTFSADMPYFLDITVGNTNVTKEFDLYALRDEIHNFRPPEPESSYLVATSAVKNILAILDDSSLLTHSPGPNGLPGGYPVRLSAQGAEVVLPASITLERAIEINKAGQFLDGIEAIEEDGTVVYTKESVKGLAEVFGMPQTRFKVEEAEERAKAFLAGFERATKTTR